MDAEAKKPWFLVVNITIAALAGGAAHRVERGRVGSLQLIS
jgi:hypothetical protein